MHNKRLEGIASVEETSLTSKSSHNIVGRQIIEERGFVDYFNLGVDCRERGDKHEAIKAWTEAIRIESYNACTYYYRGVTKIEVEDYTGAILEDV